MDPNQTVPQLVPEQQPEPLPQPAPITETQTPIDIQPLSSDVQPIQQFQTEPVKKDKKLLMKLKISLAVIGLLAVGGAMGVGAYMMINVQASKATNTASEKTTDNEITDDNNTVISVSSSDTKRKNDLSRLVTALTSFSANNRGALPSANDAAWNSFAESYLRNGGETFADPSGKDYVLSITDSLPSNFNSSNPVIIVTTDAKCDGTVLILNQGLRKAAFQMRLEGGSVICMNN